MWRPSGEQLRGEALREQVPGDRSAFVEMVSAYRFHSFELARELDRRNALRAIHTTLPRSRVPEVSARYVRSRVRLVAVQRAVGRLVPRANYPLIRATLADFDRWTSRHLEGAAVVMAMSAHATLTLQKAKADGRRVVCDRGSWHIVEQERVLQDEADRWGFLHRPFDRWGVERELSDYETADLIFVPSQPAYESFVRQGFAPERLRKVPYGTNLEAFRPPTLDEPQRHPSRIISVGAVTARKGQHYLVRAYEQVRRAGSVLELVGPIDPVLRPLLGRPSEDVVLAGPVAKPAVAERLRAAGIFVLASVEEGLALVLMEAMASGLPVIATEATGAREIVRDGIDGIIVPPADEAALAGALAELLDDPERAAAMGRAARERVEGLGGWGAYGDAAFGHLDALAARP